MTKKQLAIHAAKCALQLKDELPTATTEQIIRIMNAYEQCNKKLSRYVKMLQDRTLTEVEAKGYERTRDILKDALSSVAESHTKIKHINFNSDPRTDVNVEIIWYSGLSNQANGEGWALNY